MKMEISESNEIVRNAIKSNITNPTMAVIRNIDEFGSTKYFINPSEKAVLFSFYCGNFESMYNFALKNWLETDFKGEFLILI